MEDNDSLEAPVRKVSLNLKDFMESPLYLVTAYVCLSMLPISPGLEDPAEEGGIPLHRPKPGVSIGEHILWHCFLV